MDAIVYIVILVISFYLMARITDHYFIRSLDKISAQLKMSSDAAGATLMAVGSSAPELFIAIFALIKGFIDPGQEHEDIGIGTIVGSALFNILVIIGASGLAKRSYLNWKDTTRDLVFYSLSIAMLIWAFNDFKISLFESVIFIAVYAVYVVVVVNWYKIRKSKIVIKDENNAQVLEIDYNEYRGWRIIRKPFDKSLVFFFPKQERFYGIFFVSIIFIALLSWGLVESAVHLSQILNSPKAVIGLTVLAIGTSIPDLLSSVIVAKQGRGDMAISNSIGSNIFDILIGLGLPWCFSILLTGELIEADAKNLFISSIILFGSVVLIIAVLLLRRWKVDYRSGIFFILAYMAYLLWEIIHVI